MIFKFLTIFCIISMGYVEIVSTTSIANLLVTSSVLNKTKVLDKKYKTHDLIELKDRKEETFSKRKYVSDRVNVTLSCERDKTVVNLNFTRPFRGVIQSGDNQSSCRIKGNGQKLYSLQVPHNNCGTKHVVSTGSFFNTIFIRYHPSLEMEGDVLKTIVCKFGTESLFVG